MPAATELIAHGRSEAEVQTFIGCDWLIYQDLADLVAAVQEGNPRLKTFDTSCFSGEYVTGLSADYLEQLERIRNDAAKARRRAEAMPVRTA
jgi:amidophosphoribosyltransferase